MGIQIFSRQLLQRKVPVDQDETIGFVPLPTGAKLNNIWMDVSVMSDSVKSYKNPLFYGISGQVLEIQDPDTADTLNDIWDQQVSKDTSRQGATLDLDLNTATGGSEIPIAVAQPEYEPGYFNLEEVLQTDNRGNIEVFKRRKMLTFAKNPTGFNAAASTWIPTDHFQTHLRGGPRVEAMSYLIFGFSNPAMDNRATAEPVTISELDWFILQFLDMFLQEMVKDLVGLTTGAGGQSVSAITDFLEYASIEPDDDLLGSATFQVISKMTFDVTMPGMKEITTLTSD